MKVRPIIFVSGVLGLVVLIPVLAVIALGFYGASIGGQSSAVAVSGAELRVMPAGGPPGSTVTVTGQNWKPREEIAIYLGIPGDRGTEARRIRLLALTASRSGRFEVEVVMPSAVFTAMMTLATVEAESIGGESGPEVVSTGFEVVGFDTALKVHVVASRRGINLAGARLELSDRFGRVMSTATTGVDGVATFQGPRPGLAEIDVSLIDFRRRQVALTLPETGTLDFQIDLAPMASQRLLAPHPDSVGGGLLMYALIDRASGLALDSIGSMWLRGVPMQSVSEPGLEYRFVLPAEIRISLEGDAMSAQTPRALSSVLAVVNGLKGFREGSPSRVYFVGNAGAIDMVFATDDAYWVTQSLYFVDHRRFEIIHRVRLGPEVLPPVLSRDGAHVYAVNWFDRRVDVISVVTGARLRKSVEVPPFICAVTGDPDADALYLLSGLTGVIYHLDMAGDRVAREIATVPGATALVADPHRNRLYVFGEELELLTVVDRKSGEVVDIYALEGPIEWMWPDPDGEFLFGGMYADRAIQIIDAQRLTPVTTTYLPTMRQSQRAMD